MFYRLLPAVLALAILPLPTDADPTQLQPVRTGNTVALQISKDDFATLGATPGFRVSAPDGTEARLETLRFNWLDGVLEPVLTATLIDERMTERAETEFAAIHLAACAALAPSARAAFARYYPTVDRFVLGIASASVPEVPDRSRDIFRSGFTLIDDTCIPVNPATLQNSFSVSSANGVTLSAPDAPQIVLENARVSDGGGVTFTYRVPRLEEAPKRDLAQRLCLYNHYRGAHNPDTTSIVIALKHTTVNLLVFRTSSTQYFHFSAPAVECISQD